MIIKSIELTNFRNYDSLNIQLNAGTNIFYGDNAQGKTNILEAIFLAGTSKSHKSAKDKEMIQFDHDEAHIRIFVEKNEIEYKIDFHLRKNKSKVIAINGVQIKKAAELLGILNIVFFSPEDLNIIKNGPAERRRFMDLELCQLDKIYLSDLTKYNKLLVQRNALLKELYFKPDSKEVLPIIDQQLIDVGKKIIRRRKEFVDELNEMIHTIHSNISGGKESLNIQYEPSVWDSFFMDELSRNKERDLRMCQTSVGPHRDDMLFSINGIDIRKYGSQGQQRSTALSLKLSEIEFVKKSIGQTPVLLLDDVLSELDSNRQNYLLNSIGSTQTLITCTGLDEFVKNRFEINKIYQVISGEVFEKESMEEI